MQYTDKFGFNIPDANDYFNREHQNANWKNAETQLKNAGTSNGNGINEDLISDEFDKTKIYMINDVCIKDNTLYRFVNSNIQLFDSTKSYVVGDYVTYEDVVYTFLTDKEAGEWDASLVEKSDVAKLAGEWDESIVESTSVMNVVSEQNKNLEWYIANGYLPDHRTSNGRVYLYRAGDECIDLTGGYDITEVEGNLVKYDKYMEYTYYSYHRNGFFTQLPIDFPDWASKVFVHFDYFYFKGSYDNNKVMTMLTNENVGTGVIDETYSIALAKNQIFTNLTVEIGITGGISRYVAPIFCGSASGNYTTIARISSIWYE